jgi:hypothetical protein
MLTLQNEAASASGVATLTKFPRSGPQIQVSLRVRTGTGTVTITVQPAGKKEFESVTDGTIDASAPTSLTIDGAISAVKATSSQSSDDFDLIVVS